MIDTIVTKQQQLRQGYFQSGNGPKEILILGSCRTVPYLSYLVQWNNLHAEPFTIRRIDPCDWAVSNVDIGSLENDERILNVLKSCNIFIHEYLINWGMFNTDKDAEKNIYQFGINPQTDILIPNFNDHFILEKDYQAVGQPTPDDYVDLGELEITKFCNICKKSSLPEMAEHFWDNWRSTRFFWRPNHTSAAFSMYVFRRMNSRFLHLDLGEDFLKQIAKEDLFCSPCTPVTQRDRDGYHITWP